MATIRKRGQRWQVQIRRKGLSPLAKSFLVRSDALEWARYMEHKADRRALPYDPKKLDTITLCQLLEKYRDEVAIHKNSRVSEICLINAFLRRSPKLATLSLSNISAAHFFTYRDQRLKTVKPATVCRELGIIQHAFETAIKEWDYPMPANPLAKVRKPEVRDRRERRLDWRELLALVRALKQCRNPAILSVVLFAIQTGMRRREILAAQWQHLNLKNHTLHIPLTKNGYCRTIPLTQRARKILRSLLEKRKEGQEYIFPTTSNAIKMAWERSIILIAFFRYRKHH